jgi:hypothetical protein
VVQQAFEHRLDNIPFRVFLFRKTVTQAFSVSSVTTPFSCWDDCSDTMLIKPLMQWLAIIAFVSEHDLRWIRHAPDQAVHVSHVMRWLDAHASAQDFTCFHVDENAELDRHSWSFPINAFEIMLAWATPCIACPVKLSKREFFEVARGQGTSEAEIERQWREYQRRF